MGWEKRKGRRYYYLKVRREGKVRSVYLGNSDVAKAIDQMAAMNARWLSLKQQARVEGVGIDPWMLELGDAVFSNRRRRKRSL